MNWFYRYVYKPIATLPQWSYARFFLGGDQSKIDKKDWRYFGWRELFHSTGGLLIALTGLLLGHFHPNARLGAAYLLGVGTGFMEGIHYSHGQTPFKTVVDLLAWLWPTALLAFLL